MINERTMLQVSFIGLISLILSPATASVTSNVDNKLRTYINDGDGMSYIISGGVRKSIAYDDILKTPLDAKGKVRYLTNVDKIISVTAQPGKPGLIFDRPLTDLEIAQINQSIVSISQSASATSLAIDPKTDPGMVVDSFDALRGDQECKVTFYEKAVDACGERFGRAGVVNWTMFNEMLCNSYGGFCVGKINYNIGYQSLEGRKSIAITFLNRKTSNRFMQVFSSWSGSVPQRI